MGGLYDAEGLELWAPEYQRSGTVSIVLCVRN